MVLVGARKERTHFLIGARVPSNGSLLATRKKKTKRCTAHRSGDSVDAVRQAEADAERAPMKSNRAQCLFPFTAGSVGHCVAVPAKIFLQIKLVRSCANDTIPKDSLASFFSSPPPSYPSLSPHLWRSAFITQSYV
ncbi:calcium-translocating P-type ATPase, SERCA-type [Pseudozyma hubeiensis SY62]|uniref:Calcium-translocating P-type ATPase, SERCA-type n=1 Tax=Pseudozyma hubeiensis (strain SY62) TaxID=1305764 RepID=R9P9Y7_PSEHS|nr:calcium-translocating P-type ATPase, SERCA-type [Pseudozyma hubeiensis SY62]GAC98198.1 calcium-translocating P-type ATPase, SERCA-type [Pseudozyma hubeiensis SY62]